MKTCDTILDCLDLNITCNPAAQKSGIHQQRCADCTVSAHCPDMANQIKKVIRQDASTGSRETDNEMILHVDLGSGRN